MKKKFNPWFVIPLLAFVGLVAFMAIGLTRDPHLVPSPLINRPAPNFLLPQLHVPGKTLSPAYMKGQVWLLNVWASWCVSCREEHPVLVEYSRKGSVPIIGLNYKDERADGIAWLARLGNPYKLSAYDREGKVGIDYGVYGVPETYVIDKKGVIRYKRIGVVTPDILRDKIVPLVKELNANG